ncbi:hypothetical protein [Nitrosomonas sp. Is37]|uniref:hypothetical protein n=1 Tax=Nitrosomonas sp. Is37 TaxID=3080535 RepID=UPI00294ACAB6|nr:hypothetical protein [Nitrosomonas sp. Is37]MDV6344418.1 hypothetical protein [Nitrosomonas sp. Is37]
MSQKEINNLIDMVLSITPYPEIKGGKAPPFQDWVRKFPKLEGINKKTGETMGETIYGEEAIQTLLKIESGCLVKKPEHPFDQLARECFVACYCAAHYEEFLNADPTTVNREAHESMERTRKQIVKSTNTLINLLEVGAIVKSGV